MNRRDFIKATAALFAAPYVTAQAATPAPTPVRIELFDHTTGYHVPEAYYWSRASWRVGDDEWHDIAQVPAASGLTEQQSYDLLYDTHQRILQRFLDERGLVPA